MGHAIYSAYEFKNSLDRYWRGSLVRSVCLFRLIFIKRKLSFNSTISVRSVLIGFKCCNQGHFLQARGMNCVCRRGAPPEVDISGKFLSFSVTCTQATL